MTLPATQIFLDGRVTLYGGDCLAVLAALPENSMDSVVTDPPYHLTSLVKRFGADGAAAVKAGKTGAYARASGGFMGQKWDGGDIAFRTETWRQVWRVLKPGGYLLAFASTRGFGRMSVAIEDAGFITHPLIAWVFGSGFPKAHNAARAIDKALGCEGDKDAVGAPVRRIRPGSDQNKDGKWEKLDDRTYQPGDYVPGSPEAGAWQGWHYGGQALKPAIEPIYMGQKPFSEKNGAANILRWGTGALNIDACRVATDETITNHGHSAASGKSKGAYGDFAGIAPFQSAGQTLGRWPANLVHDGSDDVLAGFPGDKDSAARFFYSAKADSNDRIGSKHPTVKPVDLMRYLVRLVTPPGGTVLDPFAGTGTTGEAAWREGTNAVLVERQADYRADIAARMRLCVAGPRERKREIAKRRGLSDDDAGPLFGGAVTDKPRRGGRAIYGHFADQDGRLARSGSNDEGAG